MATFSQPVASVTDCLQSVDVGAGQTDPGAFSACQLLLEQPTYSNADKTAILKHLKAFGLLKSDEGPMVILRRSRGQLVRRPRTGPVEVIASGRGDWTGWLELKREAVNELATRNTARVIGDIKPDVLCIVEAEDRPALCRFNEDVFGFEQAKRPAKKYRWTFQHILLVDGNDDRGIDVGLMSRRGYDIESVRSHVDDVNSKGETIFSRDCPSWWSSPRRATASWCWSTISRAKASVTRTTTTVAAALRPRGWPRSTPSDGLTASSTSWWPAT